MNEIKYNITDQTWHKVADEDNVWIKWRFEVLKRSMKKIGINLDHNYKCLDVGCGHNNFAVNFENIEVVSFEPSTSNLRILSRNISINNLENKIKIFQIPLGTYENQFLEFNERKFNEGESHNSLDKNIDFEGKKNLLNHVH